MRVRNNTDLELSLRPPEDCGRTSKIPAEDLALSEVEARHALAKLKVKAALLPFASRYERVETRLFVAEGGIPDCIDLSWLE